MQSSNNNTITVVLLLVIGFLVYKFVIPSNTITQQLPSPTPSIIVIQQPQTQQAQQQPLQPNTMSDVPGQGIMQEINVNSSSTSSVELPVIPTNVPTPIPIQQNNPVIQTQYTQQFIDECRNVLFSSGEPKTECFYYWEQQATETQHSDFDTYFDNTLASCMDKFPDSEDNQKNCRRIYATMLSTMYRSKIPGH